MSARGVSSELQQVLFLKHWTETKDLGACLRVITGLSQGRRSHRAVLQDMGRSRAAARRQLRDDASAGRVAAAREIVATVAAARGFTALQLTGNDTYASVSRARQEALWLGHELVAGISLAELGAAVGDRAKGTVIPAVRRVAARVAADPGYGAELRAIAAGVVPIRRVA